MWAGRAKSMVSLMARGLIAAAAAMTCACAFAQDAPALPKISTVRFGGDATATRLVLDVDAALSAKVVQAQSGPRHIVLSLPRLEAPAGFSGSGQGLVKGWKLESAGGGARLTVDLTADATIKHRFVIPPGGGTAGYRYVIDFAPAPAEIATPVVTPVATIAATEPAPVVVEPHLVTATPAPPPAHAGRMVVVIDAGHGGHDPGAQGTLDGAVACEKDITLATALALRARLEKTGRYKVVLTRSTDVFVPLETRVQIARHAGADLFIALHADSAGGDASPHGASVYTLSDHGETRVNEVLGSHEWFDKAGSRSDPAVGRILLDLTQRNTLNHSAVFAQILLDRLDGKIDLLPRSHRDAGYFVLLAPDVPAVLLEMGFITNPVDQARLTDPAKRSELVDAIGGAIDTYFGGQTRVAER